MKNSLIALILAAAVFGASPASAAEWKDGRSPAQPYAGVPEVDLSQTMGYIMLYPRAKMPVEHFCDVLEIYLPREDVERGEGTLRLYDESGEILSVQFEDEEQVGIRKLSEDELNGLMWGSGVCIDIYLPVSLTIGGDYYVTMDEGCFTAADGAVVSLGYTGKEVWVPVVTGDFGINAMAYYDTGEEEETAESEAVPVPVTQPAADGEEEAEPEEVSGEVTLTPGKGDKVRFELLMGGDADVAVLYSENGSVLFPEIEYKESATVVGTVLSNDINWGVVFLNKDGDILDLMQMTKGKAGQDTGSSSGDENEGSGSTASEQESTASEQESTASEQESTASEQESTESEQESTEGT